MSGRGGAGGQREVDAGSVARGLVGMGMYWFLAAIWAGLGAFAGLVTRNSANDPRAEGWATALSGAVCGGLLLLALLFVYLGVRARGQRLRLLPGDVLLALLFVYLGVRGLLQAVGVLAPRKRGRRAAAVRPGRRTSPHPDRIT